MARLDVYRIPGRKTGYVVDIQASFLSHLATRVVVPLLPASMQRTPIRDLNPFFVIREERAMMLTQEISVILRNELGQAVASLDQWHDNVTRTVDMLLIGV